MQYVLHIEIDDETFEPLKYAECPPIPPAGARVIASTTAGAPVGILDEVEFNYTPEGCHITLLCDSDSDAKQSVTL
ncbi:hypothetical protein [Lacipirellula sp.]|uniref:hypothetical protein n=1 Tax=Lacipirellula sp. TaxID=2691419 RepID=UPI003D0DC9EE